MASNNIYPPTSPYNKTKIVDGEYLGVLDKYNAIPRNPSDASFTITPQYEFRPDMLAQDLYIDSRLWWVFASRNPNQLGPDPYFNFKSGVNIFVPKMDTLKRILGI
mgnify:FL=1